MDPMTARSGAPLRIGLVLCALLVGSISTASGQGGTAASASEVALFEQVLERLIAVATPSPELKRYWPPTDSIWVDDQVNAFAGCIGTAAAPAYRVVATTGILRKAVRQDRDLLAFIMGHELAHVLLDHAKCSRPERQVELVARALGRDQEQAADSLGMVLAVRAGFSASRAARGIIRMVDALPRGDYGSFEGLAYTHPSWFERAAFVSAMESDRMQQALWKGMSAFSNGSYFLLIEQYEAAARAFKQVTTEFPEAHEAWANLGFAQLMRYADGLDADDLRRFGVGQLVIPGFYRRPESLEERVRGINSELWWEAVNALEKALRLNPKLTLPRAHLGMAYLIHPSGTRDVANATKYLREAANLAAGDNTITPFDRVAIGINAGVAELAAGGAAETIFAQATQALGSVPVSAQRGGPLLAALDFNRSLLLEGAAGSGRSREAVQLLERYLQNTAPASAWWSLGYERYARLSRELGAQPRPEAEFRRGREAEHRPTIGVEVRPGVELSLGDVVAELTKHLGRVRPVPAITGTNLVLLRYPDLGLELLANDRVLAIVLRGAGAPAVPIRTRGLGAEAKTLRVGMSEDEVIAIAGEFYDMKSLTGAEIYYRYYRDLGIGVRVTAGRVEEIVVAQIPNS
jgi:tetratricopeptide (TPR) repeat protein